MLAKYSQAFGQLVEGLDTKVCLGDVGVCGVDVTPWAAPHEHRDHPGGKRRADVVVQPVADVGDLAGRAPALGDDPVEERRGRLLDSPAGRGADEVGRQAQRPEQALGPCRLVTRDPRAVWLPAIPIRKPSCRSFSKQGRASG